MFARKIVQYSLLSTLLCSSLAHAKIITQCSSQGTQGNVVGSENIDNQYTIASVSKVFTSLWAAEKLGLNYRYPTQIYITDLGNDLYDVHLRGSVFPYFDRTMFYFLIGELNKRGIKKINHLTYDENFEYGSIIRTKDDLAHSNGEQSETDIMKELRSDVTQLKSNYKVFLKKTQPLVKIDLPDSVQLSVKDIHAQSMKEFNPNNTTSTFILRSSEMHRVLKELNRNSNNFAADKVFERLSRTQKFNDFLTKSIKVDDKEFNFINGSGYPEIIDGKKIYNSATCRTVIEMMKKLMTLSNQQGFGLRYILPVAGFDAEADGDSTVTNIYLTPITQGALIAKTGTVDGSVSLAGTVLTNNDLVYFHATATSGGYNDIKKFLSDLYDDHGGKKEIENYTPKAFVPFDEKSIEEVKK